MPTGREEWFAEVLRAGLETKLLTEPDILQHASPAVLISALPKDTLVRMLELALDAGTITPKSVVQTATPDLLASHVPNGVLWACVAAAATRAGIPDDKPGDAVASREFLRRVLDAGLRAAVLTPGDVVQHVNAKVLGYHFPDALNTKLLEASLAAGKMNAELIVETLGVDNLAKHAPTAVLWACVARAGEGGPVERAPGERAAAAPPARPAVAHAPTAPTAPTAIRTSTLDRRPTPPAGVATVTVPARAPAPAAPAALVEDDLVSLEVDFDDPTVARNAPPMPGLPDDKARKGFFGRPRRP